LNNRTVFGNSVLCAQFLRDYADIALLKDVQPEDIEDVSRKYQAYLGISFETDTVKKIRIRPAGAEEEESIPLYLISLVEHKSQVDYNVSMQLLRYMICIWTEYGKEIERRGEGRSSNKSFKYPPILPIVYYEGADKWTADLHLKDRIMMSGIFSDYLPDFTYKLVRNHDYSNEELLDKKDEMSLLMMINKVQTPEDMENFLNSQRDKVERIVRNAPEHILEIICSAIWSLCMKMNVPQEEAELCVEKVRERQMGYWFENVKMDIQAERRKAEEACREAEERVRQAEKRAEKMVEELAEKKAEELAEKREKEAKIEMIVFLCQEYGDTKEAAIMKMMQKCGFSRAEAEKKADVYWKE
jgi:Putative transposase, YhgA-like.